MLVIGGHTMRSYKCLLPLGMIEYRISSASPDMQLCDSCLPKRQTALVSLGTND